jgi:hypothetical protein
MTLNEWKEVCERVERLSDDKIYSKRGAIAAMMHRAYNESREFMDFTDCRAQGYILRGIAERLEDKLTSVTRPH